MATGLTRFHNTQRRCRKVRKFTGHELMAPNIKVACGIVLCSLRGANTFIIYHKSMVFKVDSALSRLPQTKRKKT
uniref:Uncharacterized protein n=1 Tax=Anguilla anguilla TaxID=7936 RepID=A0A0E9SGL5_ANGAN